MTRLVTFLGITDYRELAYALPGASAPVKTRFIARALAEACHCDAVIVMATDAAWKENGAALQEALADLGIRPERRKIPDGKSETELRAQFRKVMEALGPMSTPAPGTVLDITHGYRPQPFFAATALAVLSASADLPQNLRITYGAMEATDENGITPIWDLTPFLMMQELAQGIATFRHTGHASALIAALKRETERLSQRKRAGKRDSYDQTNKLVSAIESFAGDLATLRLPDLTYGRGKKKGSAAHLLASLETYADHCHRDHPALVPLLDDLAGMASPLAVRTLFGEEGRQALTALARLYLSFTRPLEAAAVAREGYVGLFGESPAATDAGRAAFDESLRRRAEARARQSPAFRTIADPRNDLLHCAMRKNPVPAEAAGNNAESAVETFAAAAAPPPSDPAAAPAPRTLFVTRHKGAVEWARRRGIEAEIVQHLDPATVTPGDTVIGTLPVHLAAEICRRGARYQHLSIDIPPERRGSELTADDMEAFAARLAEYTVKENVGEKK